MGHTHSAHRRGVSKESIAPNAQICMNLNQQTNLTALCLRVFPRSLVRQFRTLGSARGASSNRRPYLNRQKMHQDSSTEWRRSKSRAFAVILGFGLGIVGLAPQGVWILFGSDQLAIPWALPIWFCIVVTTCYAVATRSKLRSNIAHAAKRLRSTRRDTATTISRPAYMFHSNFSPNPVIDVRPR